MPRFALLLMLPAFSLRLGSDALVAVPSASAAGLTPIELTMAGPDAIRIRVAQGSTFPCDSGDNHVLLEGKFEPGRVVRLSTPDRCVCLQQTYAPFSDVDWGASGMACRPMVCKYWGRGRHCTPAPDPTIRLTLRSTRPN